MADFVKKDWKCGDTITADDLNRLENGVEEALDGGSVDCGYSCTEEWVTLTDESVTTANDDGDIYAFLSYENPITSETIKVTFDGTEYICNKSFNGPGLVYYNSDSPFTLRCSGVSNMLYTETEGTYQVKIEASEKTVETSECFKKAVESVRTGAFQVRAVSKDADTGMVTYNCSVLQLQDAFVRGDYITFYDGLSESAPLMLLRDCVVGWDSGFPTLVGMLRYEISQTSAQNSKVISMKIKFNAPSNPDEILTRGDSGGDPK